MKEDRSIPARPVSRRDFLRLSAIGSVGTALAGSLAACDLASSSSTGEGSAGAGTSSASGDSGFEIINCDFLVIGSGNNALSVIAQAMSEGHHVTVVDKGTLRHSGTSGMSWDAFSAVEIADDPKKDPTIQGYLGYQLNAQMLEKALQFDPQPNKIVYNINHGQYMPDRQDDGSIAFYLDIPGYCQGQFYRREIDQMTLKSRSSAYDRTMITDILISEGRCVGALGLHLPTGSFRIFRSPVTVLATGGCTWIYGCFSVSAYSIGTPDNTADADMALFRHGLGIGDAEYTQYDVMSCEPRGLACGFGSGVCGDAQEAHAIFDANGELVFDPNDSDVANRIYFNQELGRVVFGEKRGTANGGVLLNVGDSHIRYSNERNIELLREFGFDVRSQPIEAVPEMYEHGGQPVIDENMMTEVDGLFHARGAGTTGEVGGAQVHFNRIYGPWAAHCAGEYLKTAAEIDDIDWSGALAEYHRLQEIRTRTASDGIYPHEIRKRIQTACYGGLGVYRNADNMSAAIAELERIRREDMPRQVIRNASPVWNKEWKEAIENINMLDIAEISVRASLGREETRGMYLRSEFPQRDDANWACIQVCYLKDGDMEFEKREMPRSDWL
ncbi:MAG: hypothetical protein LBI64_08320 [Coriobacteriales bacterium]|jgi:succinate dehydrogenase / fumarate reductase flavoprotein subunit|nr:hypothetical protein [Coriobacteriales bacterium]